MAPGPDGLLIRELGAADRVALAFLFGRLGATSRYQRFLRVKDELSADDLDELTDVDHWHREALIAWSPVPRAPIGVARYVRCAEFDVAEIAVTVVDTWQRRGIGGALLLALRERAERAGIRTFTATMLYGNRGALALVHGLGTSTVASAGSGALEVSGSWGRPPWRSRAISRHAT